MNHTIRRRVISDVEFLRVWRGCSTPQQVEARLGWGKSSVKRRVAEMRKRGVEVPPQEIAA